METRAHHVLIGLFTVLVAAAAVLFCLWLNKSSGDKNLNYYTVVFNEAVSGLSKGSPVQYSGIKVGDVVGLTLDPQDPRKVLARIRVEGNIPIKQDTGGQAGAGRHYRHLADPVDQWFAAKPETGKQG